MLTKSMEKPSILTKGCVLLCLILLSFCPTPTDALPTHLSRRGDDVWDIGWTTPITNFDGLPDWVLGLVSGGAAYVGSQPGPNSVTTISPESAPEEQPLPGAEGSEMTGGRKVPATQPPEDASFYGTPKPVPGPTSGEKLPPENEQPDLGTVWVPKSKAQGQ